MPHRAPGQVEEHLPFHRFAEIVVASQAHRLGGAADTGKAGDDDDGGVKLPPVALGQEIEAGLFAAQVDVGEDGVVVMLAEEPDGRLVVTGAFHQIAVLAQEAPKGVAQIGIIFNNEDSGWHGQGQDTAWSLSNQAD